jgi:RNA polymerase sigma-70 factor (ECF subfamily)
MERVPSRADDRLGQIEDVYRHQYRRFLRLALAMLGDRERAHDAVQETFARAIRSRFDFRGEGSLEGWLWKMLTNHCRDVLRAPQPAAASDRAVATLQTRDDHPLEHAALRAAIAALPEQQRTMVFLRHYADLDYEAIAEVTGVACGTVAATLHAARATLQRTMEGTTA